MRTAALVLFTAALSIPAFAQQVDTSPCSVLASAGQRYVFGQVSAFRRDQYLLDTKTGRLWQVVQAEDGSARLQSVPYTILNGKMTLAAPSEEHELGTVSRVPASSPSEAEPTPTPRNQ